MKSQVSVNKLAYSKAIFHCLKYPSSNVVGVFTGKDKQITNAYPLFHTPVVSPSLEIAFGLIETQLKQDQVIIGVYTSAINCEVAISDLALKFAESIQKVSGQDPILMNIFLDEVDEENKLSYSLFYGLGKERIERIDHQFKDLQKEISEGKHRQIVDFDGHFQNIDLDFTNSYLNK